MVGEEGTSNGDTKWLKRERLNNGCRVGIEHDFFDINSSQCQGFQTYKRRKHARLSSKGKSLEDSTSSVWVADKMTNKNFRDVVLEDMYQSLSDDEGGIRGCIRETLESHPEIDSATKAKRSDTLHSDRNVFSQTGIPNGTLSPAKSHVDGLLPKSDHCIKTDNFKRAFLDIITSEKFTLLCKVLLENFQGIKVDRIFDLCAINLRMKRGSYENSPMLFMADMQQVWKTLQEIGDEIINLAENLSALSQTSYNEHVGGSACCTFEEGKNELSTLEPDSGVKVEQTAACDVYKVRSCMRCEEMADEKNGLVCDSCEEMYHVSCIEPAVKKIPPKSWYCAKCSAKGFGSAHENCVVCDRLSINALRFKINEAADVICPTIREMSSEFEENSNCTTADVGKPSCNKIDNGKWKYICKICCSNGESSDKFRLCEYPYCCSKSYHERCLTPKQLKLYGPRWYCPSCLCRACFTDTDDDKIVMCDGCDLAYHLYCMEPPREAVPKDKWFCRKCDDGIQEISRMKRAYDAHNLKRRCEKESDKGRGGMDVLLNAARSLSFREMAAVKM